MDHRVYLSVKVASLAAEARIIRQKERRHPRWRPSLYAHRTQDVRREARSAQLALGFLRGHPYRAVENTHRTTPDVARVRGLVKKFGLIPGGMPGGYPAYRVAKAEEDEAVKAWFREGGVRVT